MENGKWKMENGKRKMENEKWKMEKKESIKLIIKKIHTYEMSETLMLKLISDFM